MTYKISEISIGMKLGNSRNEINSSTVESWFQSMSSANCVFNTPISLLTSIDLILRIVFPHGDKRTTKSYRFTPPLQPVILIKIERVFLTCLGKMPTITYYWLGFSYVPSWKQLLSTGK